jgi:hypothetical protein
MSLFSTTLLQSTSNIHIHTYIHTYIFICVSGIHRCATSTEYETCQKSQKHTLDTEHPHKQIIRHYYITNMS